MSLPTSSSSAPAGRGIAAEGPDCGVASAMREIPDQPALPLCAWCEQVPVKSKRRTYCSQLCCNKAIGAKLATRMRRPCAWCKNPFTPHQKRQRHCGRPCASAARGITTPEHVFSAMARKSVARRIAKRESNWDLLVAGMTVAEAAAFAYKRGYQAGWLKGRQPRFSEGVA